MLIRHEYLGRMKDISEQGISRTKVRATAYPVCYGIWCQAAWSKYDGTCLSHTADHPGTARQCVVGMGRGCLVRVRSDNDDARVGAGERGYRVVRSNNSVPGHQYIRCPRPSCARIDLPFVRTLSYTERVVHLPRSAKAPLPQRNTAQGTSCNLYHHYTERERQE